MGFELKELPYANDALEPFLSKETLEYHYGKHHQGYVNKLNAAVKGTDFEQASLEDIIKKADGGIFNNGAQVWNHTFYWESLTPEKVGKPAGRFLEAITRDIGNMDDFKEKFTQAATTLFGSGWVWLAENADKKLEIIQGQNAYNPIRDRKIPILTLDVWEHAFYIDYRNAKAKYIDNFWDYVNWDALNKRIEYHDVTGRIKED